MIFVGIVEKKGSRGKTQIPQKSVQKRGQCTKRGCTKKGYHQCIGYDLVKFESKTLTQSG